MSYAKSYNEACNQSPNVDHYGKMRLKTRLIVTLDYNKYLLPEFGGAELMSAFAQLVKVKSKGYGKEQIFVPEDERPSIEFLVAFENQIRPETPEEIEDTKIKDLESSLTYNKNRVDELQKKVKELECINAVLAADEIDDEGEDDA